MTCFCSKQRKFRLRRIISVSLVLLLSLGLLLQTELPVWGQRRTGAIARGTGGVVASPHQAATQAGLEVLKAGGNAIDAAVATAAALGVVEPLEAGIGGGGFMVIYLKAQNRVVTLDGRETAPLAAGVDLFKDPGGSGADLPFMPNRVTSGAAVGVPGTLLTWTEALDRYGTLSLEKVLQPAIALASRGFKVNSNFAKFIAQNKLRFSTFTSTRDLYLPNGEVPKVGSTFTNPDLAQTYRLIGQQGANAFYRGAIGQAIVSTVQKPPTVKTPAFQVVPGKMTLTDLDYYHVQVRPPIATNYRGYKFYGMGLPSSGGITSTQVLNLVKGFDLAKMEKPQALHTLIESERLAYADRSAYLGDPKYVDVPVPGLLSQSYAQQRRRLIDDWAPAAPAKATPGNPLSYQTDPSPSLTLAQPQAAKAQPEGLTTAHLSVADRFGNVVAYTLTIEQLGGSGMVVPGYGFLLNNELTDFNLESPNPNAPEPGKRPLSSMAPTLVLAPDGSVIALGSPGGSTIITTVVGIAVNLIDFNLGIDQAIAAPRFSQRNTGATQVEGGFEATPAGRALVALGHQLEPVPEIGAATGLVVYPNGSMVGAAEPTRRGGGSAMVVKSAS